jgi:hypothetical protein
VYNIAWASYFLSAVMAAAIVNRAGFDGGFILWEDVAHASIEPPDVEAGIGTPAPA